MPNLDTTGPVGNGPTGLRRGGCVRADEFGLQRGAGRRFTGKRCRCPFYDNTDPLSLKEEERLLQKRLAEVQRELEQTV